MPASAHRLADLRKSAPTRSQLPLKGDHELHSPGGSGLQEIAGCQGLGLVSVDEQRSGVVAAEGRGSGLAAWVVPWEPPCVPRCESGSLWSGLYFSRWGPWMLCRVAGGACESRLRLSEGAPKSCFHQFLAAEGTQGLDPWEPQFQWDFPSVCWPVPHWCCEQASASSRRWVWGPHRPIPCLVLLDSPSLLPQTTWMTRRGTSAAGP